MACVQLAKDNPAPTVGDAVTFTCTQSGGDIVEFRYKVGSSSYQNLAAKNLTQSQPLIITQVGAYTIQCRSCKTGGTSCTTWGMAQ